MSPFHFSTKTIRSLQLDPEDNPSIQIEEDHVVITAQRGDERIMIKAAIPGAISGVVATTVSLPNKKTRLSTHPMKGAVLPSTDKRTGENNALSKLTAKQVLEIRELASDADIMKAYGTRTNFCVEIGRVYSVHHTTVGNIINRASWKHI